MPIRSFVAAAMAAGCATSSRPLPAASSSPAASSACIADVHPIADHHQHLISPAGDALLYPQPLPAVPVPQEVAQLLSKVETHWNEPAALEPLLTDGARMRTTEGAGWAKGRGETARALGTLFGRPYRMTPVAFSAQDRTANLEGFFTRGDGPRRHFGSFQLALVRGADGAFQIDAVTPVFPGPIVQPPVDAKELVGLLDDAHMEKAVVLSDAYWFDPEVNDAGQPQPDDLVLPKVRAENDWTAAQVALFPSRLVAFCSFNPLRSYALDELTRCVKSGSFKGLKLHFNTSRVDLRNPDHLARVKRVFEAANRLRMPIVLHARTRPKYEAEDARILLEQLVPLLTEVPIQIAHLWGGEALTEPVLAAYADAVSSNDPRFRRVYFDVAEAGIVVTDKAARQRVVERMRQIGMDRILYGSDAPETEAKAPKDAWTLFREAFPLTGAEVRQIAANVAPYLR